MEDTGFAMKETWGLQRQRMKMEKEKGIMEEHTQNRRHSKVIGMPQCTIMKL